MLPYLKVVPKITGPLVGLIFTKLCHSTVFKHFVQSISLIFDPVDPFFHLFLDLFDPFFFFLQNLISDWVHFSMHAGPLSKTCWSMRNVWGGIGYLTWYIWLCQSVPVLLFPQLVAVHSQSRSAVWQKCYSILSLLYFSHLDSEEKIKEKHASRLIIF